MARSRTDDRESEPQVSGSSIRRIADAPGWSRRSRSAATSSTRSCCPRSSIAFLLMGGTFEIRECKIGVHRTDPSYARIAIQADDARDAGRDPRRSGRARGVADASRRRHDRRGRYRRRVSRWILQHDQPGDPGSGERALDHGRRTRKWTAESWLTARSGLARCIPMDTGGDRDADRRRPRRRARAADRAVA